MKRLLPILLFVLLAGNVLAQSNPIIVGVVKFAPPFSTTDTSNYMFGFCIDFMNEICKRLNETCKYKSFTVDQQLPALDAGTVDITFLPSPISEDMFQYYIYSIPYMTSDGQFLTLDPNIKSVADLKDKNIGILEASHLKAALLRYTSKDNIKEYVKSAELFSAIQNKEVEAILVNVNIAKYILSNHLMNFYVVGKNVSLGNGYGIIALKSKADLINRINKAILQIQNDGTYEIIYDKYFGK